MATTNLWEKHVDKVVSKILDILGTKKYEESLVAKVTYILQVLIGELEKGILLCIFFWLTGNLVDFIIAFITLVLLRPFTGGMHRKTLAGCFLHTICVFGIIILLSNNIMINNEIYILTIMFLIYLIIRFIPIQSANRICYNAEQRLIFKVKALISVEIIFISYMYVPLQYYNVMMFVVLVHTGELTFLCSQLHKKGEKSNERKFKKEN